MNPQENTEIPETPKLLESPQVVDATPVESLEVTKGLETEERLAIEKANIREPDKMLPKMVPAVATGKMRKTILGDFPEVYEYMCMMKACFVTAPDIVKELHRKFGLSFPLKTVQGIANNKKYGMLIDKYRQKFAKSKIREIPYAYRFKRLEKLSKMLDDAKEAQEVSWLTESIRREMEKCEDALLETDMDEDISPDTKKRILVETAIKLLHDPSLRLERLENAILGAADIIKRVRNIRKVTDIGPDGQPLKTEGGKDGENDSGQTNQDNRPVSQVQE